jgi:2,3,4,5-tetrahydropyridine-2-carboxylate N-succinyltransferase
VTGSVAAQAGSTDQSTDRSTDLLADLESGRRRAAWPDPTAADGWRVDAAVKEGILALFRTEAHAEWQIGDGLLGFRDRAALPTRRLVSGDDGVTGPAAAGGWRIVPGGTSVRGGAYLGPGVVVMPPSFINIGAWVGAGVMVDSLVLVGSCAQVGDRVHLAAGVVLGGVLEPPNARPVIVEEDAFVGAGAQLLDGVLVGRGAVIGAGVTLTGTSRLYDLVDERLLEGTPERPLAVPPGAVIVPGVRALSGAPDGFAREHGLGLATALIVKGRDTRTSARVALEEALR